MLRILVVVSVAAAALGGCATPGKNGLAVCSGSDKRPVNIHGSVLPVVAAAPAPAMAPIPNPPEPAPTARTPAARAAPRATPQRRQTPRPQPKPAKVSALPITYASC